MRFNELKGLDGIDKLDECVPYVDEIFSDKELFENVKDLTWMQIAKLIYKAHTDSINAIMEILDEKPETAVDIIRVTAEIVTDIFMDEGTRNFFISFCKNVKFTLSAMVNIVDGQSEDSSTT